MIKLQKDISGFFKIGLILMLDFMPVENYVMLAIISSSKAGYLSKKSARFYCFCASFSSSLYLGVLKLLLWNLLEHR